MMLHRLVQHHSISVLLIFHCISAYSTPICNVLSTLAPLSTQQLKALLVGYLISQCQRAAMENRDIGTGSQESPSHQCEATLYLHSTHLTLWL